MSLLLKILQITVAYYTLNEISSLKRCSNCNTTVKWWNANINSFALVSQAPGGTDLRQRTLWMPRGHLRPGNSGEGRPGLRERFSYCYVWVPFTALLPVYLIQRVRPAEGPFKVAVQRMEGVDPAQGSKTKCVWLDVSCYKLDMLLFLNVRRHSGKETAGLSYADRNTLFNNDAIKNEQVQYFVLPYIRLWINTFCYCVNNVTTQKVLLIFINLWRISVSQSFMTSHSPFFI